MDQYTDLKVLECNRLHSEEAKSNNNENYAHWTNNLQDIVQLDAGDKVSLYGAMVSERGAGQGSTIEIKGESLGFTKVFNYTDVQKLNVEGGTGSSTIANCDTIKAIDTPVTKDIRDDTGYFIMNYYCPANGHNYIDLPRRFWYNEDAEANWTTVDSQVKGMSLSDPFNMFDAGPGLNSPDRYALYDDFYQIYTDKDPVSAAGEALLSKVKKDNARYTIMMCENTYFTEEGASAGDMPPALLREPEYQNYQVYRELKEITVDPGFNTPEIIATKITRQLQTTINNESITTRDGTDLTQNQYTPGFPISLSKIIESETYKAFNVAGFNGDFGQPAETYNKFINASTNLYEGYEYLRNYHVVGCKRPELYETGRLLNRGFLSALERTRGSTTQSETDGEYFDISIRYEKQYVEQFRDFILAQEKYPEVFNIFSDSRTPYNALDTIDNARWCHINRYKNASMTLSDATDIPTLINKSTLGYGGYQNFTWNASNQPLNSVILPFVYDASQKDIYYDNPDESLGQKSFGCFGKAGAYIRVYGTPHNGVGSALLTMLLDGETTIEERRKIGFDQHFSAPGMTYILPFHGNAGIQTYAPVTDLDVDGFCRSGNLINGASPYNNDPISDIQLSKLYLGANVPALQYDGTHFFLSDFHTSLNSGNDNRAGREDTIKRNDQGSDVVYKINPSEQYNDWTPARKPYIDQLAATAHRPAAKYLNTNLEPWRIYDNLTGIMIENFNLTEQEWTGSLWSLLGFTYAQFHSSTNTRLDRINNSNVNSLSLVTTNSDISEGETKNWVQNMFKSPLYTNMLPSQGTYNAANGDPQLAYKPEIVEATTSIQIIAENLPTRMIRGYYTIRSNVLQDAPFIGGKVNNTTMPIIGVVNKISNFGDFTFGEESSLQFTITKPIRLASIACSVHDPDGSYARVSEQSTVLIKIQKDRRVTYNVAQEIINEQQQQKK